MAYKVIVSPLAQDDLKIIADYYENQSTGLGIRFIDSFQKSSEFILLGPEMFALRYKNIRALSVAGFPYNIYYFVLKEQVNIIGIIHQKRNLKTWKKRR
jgi:toxin ParE1/3/4